MESKDVVEFGGWPQPPRWVWVVAGVAAAAVLVGVVVARTGPHHAASSPTPAAAAGSAPQWWPSPPSPCRPTGDMPLPVGSLEGTVRLWNPATGRPVGARLHVGSADLAGVFGMAFSPDGKLLASASGDGTVRLWNQATRRPVGAPLQVGSGLPELPDHGRLVAVFSPGGALIASCWSASPGVARP